MVDSSKILDVDIFLEYCKDKYPSWYENNIHWLLDIQKIEWEGPVNVPAWTHCDHELICYLTDKIIRRCAINNNDLKNMLYQQSFNGIINSD